MTHSIQIPVGQKLLSNVSVVKYKRDGEVFELAVFPNKVTSWRNGLESDINSVLQSNIIFSNVDQGLQAKHSQVKKILKVQTLDEAVTKILTEGKIKLATKERKIVQDNLTKNIASIVASQCVNTITERPISATHVERAMKEIGYSVNHQKSPKVQAISLIRKLKKEGYPIERAKIRLEFFIKSELADQMISMLNHVESVNQNDPETTAIIAQIDPGSLRSTAISLAEIFGETIQIDILELNVNPLNDKEISKVGLE